MKKVYLSAFLGAIFYTLTFSVVVAGADDFERKMRLLEERIKAREIAQQELEGRRLKAARKKAQIEVKKATELADARVDFLKKTFERKKKERDQKFKSVLGELQCLENEVGGKYSSGEYDSWAERQELKAVELREQLKRERKLLDEHRRAAREEVALQEKKKEEELQARFAREKRQKLEREREEGRYFYLYAAPAWPKHSLLFERNGLVVLQTGVKGFPHGFVGDGNREQLARLEYYDGSLTLKDLVCECGLLASGTVASKGGAWDDNPASPELARNPLYVLRDAQVSLESRRFEIPFLIGGSMGIGGGSTVLSLFFPFVYHNRELKISVTAPSGADDFGNAALARYVGDPGALLKEVFDLRSLDVGGTDSGFVTANARASLYWKGEFRRKMKWLLGLTASFPVIVKEGSDRLQQPRLSNTYFPSCGLFLGSFIQHSRFLNPHLFGQAQIFFSKNFSRRLGHHKTYSGTGDLPLLMTNFVQPTGSSAFGNVLDSKVALFAEELARVTVARPGEITVVAGNQMKEVVGISGFLDLFYMLRIRVEDNVVLAESDDMRQRELGALLFKDQEVEHRVGCAFRYQFNSKFTINVGAMYSLAGQCVPETYELTAAIRAEF